MVTELDQMTETISAEALEIQLVAEGRAMASHALANGLQVPAWAMEAVVTELPLSPENLKKVSRAHAYLAGLCAPVIPAVVVALQNDSRGGRWNRLVRAMLITAALSLFAFLAISLSGTINDPRSGNIFSSSGWPLLVNELFFLSAAALGASFAALLQLDRDLKQGTFDPRSHASHWVRFILGLVSGVLLATLIHVGENANTGDSAVAKRQLSAAALALLGGFASSVVERILQRLVESLETAVRGSAEGTIAAREQELRSKLTAQATADRLKMATMLSEVQRGLASGKDPEALRRSIDRSISQFVQGDMEAADPSPPPPPAPAPLPPAPAGAPADPAASPSSGQLAVRAIVEDTGGAPISGVRYDVLKGDVLVGQGTTDAAGAIQHPVDAEGDYGVVIKGPDAAPAAVTTAAPTVLAVAPSPGTSRLSVTSRALSAWHSARREISRGITQHGKGQPWEVPSRSNRGPVIDDYLRTVSGVASAAAWCGIFQGYNYIKAGFKTEGEIPAAWTPDGRPMGRKTIFLSASRLMLYFTKSGCKHLILPAKDASSRPKTRAECAAWLAANLNPFAPVPGDLVLFDTAKQYSHVGMIASYDPATFELTTYEGNLSDRASAWRWDLADPSATGFYRVNLFGRFMPEDFDADPEVPPESQSPEPVIEGGGQQSAS